MSEQPVSSTPGETPPPAAVESPTPTDRLERMTPEERTTWRNTGAVPGVESPAPAKADEADDEAPEPDGAPPTDPTPPTAAAASDAGKTLNKRKQTAQERINELSRKIYLQEGELTALRQQSSRPAAAAEPQPQRSASASPLPPGFSFPTYEQWSAAYPDQSYETYTIVAADALFQYRRQQQTAVDQDSRIVSTFADRVTAFKADHPDYDAVTSSPEVSAIAPMQFTYLHRAIAESEHGPALAYYLGTHVEELRRLAAQPTALAFDRLFGKLEAQIEAQAKAAASPASTTNHITQAPAPPPTLGSRPVVPGDEVEAAVRRKDPGEYMRAMNARELAARGR